MDSVKIHLGRMYVPCELKFGIEYQGIPRIIARKKLELSRICKSTLGERCEKVLGTWG